MRKRMSEDICKLTVFRITGTRQPGIKFIFRKKQSECLSISSHLPLTKCVLISQQMPYGHFSVSVKESFSMHVSTEEADPGLSDVPPGCSGPEGRNQSEGLGWRKGKPLSSGAYWSCYYLEPREVRRQLQDLQGAGLAFFSFYLLPAVAPSCMSSPTWLCWPLAQAK